MADLAVVVSNGEATKMLLTRSALVLAFVLMVVAPVSAAEPYKLRIGWVVAGADLATLMFAKPGLAVHAGTSYTPELIHFERKGVPVTLSFIEREADGTLVTPGKWRDWPWPPDSLSAPRGRIGSLTTPIVSLASQIETKSNYAVHIHGAPLRPQDEADLSLLYAFREQTPVAEQSTGAP